MIRWSVSRQNDASITTSQDYIFVLWIPGYSHHSDDQWRGDLILKTNNHRITSTFQQIRHLVFNVENADLFKDLHPDNESNIWHLTLHATLKLESSLNSKRDSAWMICWPKFVYRWFQPNNHPAPAGHHR